MEKKYDEVMEAITQMIKCGLTEKGMDFHCELLKQLNKARSDFQLAVLNIEQRMKDLK